ncbi:MAG: phosphoribosylformylglycinamidine synthase [Sphaerochaetaceae bacterium]|nr:phosphoribosylformylglycinamidine synthase [Sphaerochaetaceae bacterium]
MINTVYVKKKNNFKDDILREELNLLLNVKIDKLVTFNRYEVEDISPSLFKKSVSLIFSEVNLDEVYYSLPSFSTIFAIELLDGQFDQRADSAIKCITLLQNDVIAKVKYASIYGLEGDLNDTDIDKIKNYLINPVESKLADLESEKAFKKIEKKKSQIKKLNGFINLSLSQLNEFRDEYNLAMDIEDLRLFQKYFINEKRDPTLTELKVVDTYWSDHCRHTTFNTIFDKVEINDSEIKETYNSYLNAKKKLNSTKPNCLMDIATIATKILKKEGYAKDVEESEEINACSVNVKVDVNGSYQDYLLLFKNETHNHPTEIEPFGGAATCIGGAIRDPLSSRAYVYQAMRISGTADPREPFNKTMANKLPQRTIAKVSAKGNSSYGNQIGLATSLVKEFYHDGYKAKHLELGAVIAAAKKENVVRETPCKGDVVILLGGRTGRDGIGGATGSSKSHNLESLETCGAEVQKGNATEERKLQRLFKDGSVTKLIKRCNDFGAGGVCVAIGELSRSLNIELDKVPLKYENLEINEIAISESQERMAIVVNSRDIDFIIEKANKENIEASVVATIEDNNKLTMMYDGEVVVDISRDFLDTNGSEKYTSVLIEKEDKINSFKVEDDLKPFLDNMYSDLDFCSQKGLSNIFDSTIGASSVLLPYGGKFQASKEQVMCAKLPVDGKSDTVSLMSYGFDPKLVDNTPYKGSYISLISSVSKLIASGAKLDSIYLSLQEYFASVKNDSLKWGNVSAALLGALKAQLDLKIPAIGGKDSMSGSYEDLDVPNTLVSFAVGLSTVDKVRVSLLTKENSKLIIFPISTNVRDYFSKMEVLIKDQNILSSFSLCRGGLIEALCEMSFGNKIGFTLSDDVDLNKYNIGSILLEVNSFDKIKDQVDQLNLDYDVIGKTTSEYNLKYRKQNIDLNEIFKISQDVLEGVYPTKVEMDTPKLKNIDFNEKNVIFSKQNFKKPRVVIPVFFGTNCELDSVRAFNEVGAEVEQVIINTLNFDTLRESTNLFINKTLESQILFIPGGFSAADEPEGSAKFISSFLQAENVKDSINNLLYKRDGLILGICNGFQALVKSGLLPYSKISSVNENSPTLTYNKINQHQSSLVKVRVSSNKSPWMMHYNVGDTYYVPISHGEGRFVCNDQHLTSLIKNGQIACQYVDNENMPSMDINYNPNGSVYAIESITNDDGRILGRMGHLERCKDDLYKNVREYKANNLMFKGAISYFN